MEIKKQRPLNRGWRTKDMQREDLQKTGKDLSFFVPQKLPSVFLKDAALPLGYFEHAI
jgi:hypothetical protein